MDLRDEKWRLIGLHEHIACHENALRRTARRHLRNHRVGVSNELESAITSLDNAVLAIKRAVQSILENAGYAVSEEAETKGE